MSWIPSTLRSAADDVRRRVDQAENEAHAAVDRAKQAASSALDAVRSRAAPPSGPPPTRAVDMQASDASIAFAKNAVANLAAQRGGVPKLPTPHDIPSLIPDKDVPGSTADKARRYVMFGAGAATGFATSHLGPGGAVMQGVLDVSVHQLGTADDKVSFGSGQIVGAGAAFAHGLMLDSVSTSAEVGTGGGASAVALPAIAVGTLQMAVAGTNALTGAALLSSGAPPSKPMPAAAEPPKTVDAATPPEAKTVHEPAGESQTGEPDGTTPSAQAAPVASTKAPAVEVPMDHIIDPGMSADGRSAVGHHSKTSAAQGVHYVPGTRSAPDANGVYTETFQIKSPKNGALKTKESTFFPDSYSRSQVKQSVEEAWSNHTMVGQRKWSGRSADGIKIEGYVDGNGKMTTAFPVREGS